MTVRRRPDGSTSGGTSNSGNLGGGLGNLANVFSKLSGLVEQVSELAQAGQELQREGQLGDDKGVRAVYGFSVRVGGPGGAAKVEPFGNIKPGRGGDRAPVVETVREPLTDVFEEDDHVLVVAELPGVAEDTVRHDLRDGVLVLDAGSGERRYHKELRLPVPVRGEGARAQLRNGVFELKLTRVR